MDTTVFDALHKPVAQRIGLIREGFPAEEVDIVSNAVGMSKQSLLDILGTPQRTVNRMIKTQRRLDPAASERLLRVVEIEQRAEEVFGDKTQAREWLTNANAVLGAVPLQLLDTELGANQVRRALTAIEHGLPV
ncbi:type II RES/Xre toxin-antitoxin system antitoxin [Paludibacterium paludis]|uniref:Uncharacterized protein n=1 Tax=Paludibacterium paludis TaxID=1225769 RepID=A0A918NXK0_9NEIS|nr:antitoxin Xre/MbcA/ParS toxin-binding domain-containing protein [Paludibacterium paludis]GGY05101.1 hypothetical protein GCM10011289_04580 [Paludibacterium paludis]